jgi:hypothetical protein
MESSWARNASSAVRYEQAYLGVLFFQVLPFGGTFGGEGFKHENAGLARDLDAIKANQMEF